MKIYYKGFTIQKNEYGAWEFHNQWDGEVTPASSYQDCIEQIDNLTE